MIEFLFYFHVYAFLGWCVEVIYQQLKRGKFINRGMLAGPYCPIYGFGMLLLISFTEPIDDNFFALLLASALFCTVLELAVGLTLDIIFHERWWDYSEEPFNIGGYVCLRFSIIWGIAGAVVMKELHPFVENLMEFLPDTLLVILTAGLSVSILVDTVLTVVQIKGLDRQVDELVKLYEVHENMRKFSDRIGRRISDSTAKTSSKVKAILEDPEFQERANQARERLTRVQKRLIRSYPNLRGNRSELQENILRHWATKDNGN